MVHITWLKSIVELSVRLKTCDLFLCYLGDMLSAGGGCELAGHHSCENCLEEVQGATTSCHTVPPLLLYNTRGHVYSLRAECHAPCQWNLAVDQDEPAALAAKSRAMIRQICGIKPEGMATVRSSELLAKLELEDLDLILRERRLRWPVLTMWNVLVRCSMWYTGGREVGGRKTQADMEEMEGKGLLWVEAHDHWLTRKEHLEIRCEIILSYQGLRLSNLTLGLTA